MMNCIKTLSRTCRLWVVGLAVIAICSNAQAQPGYPDMGVTSRICEPCPGVSRSSLPVYVDQALAYRGAANRTVTGQPYDPNTMVVMTMRYRVTTCADGVPVIFIESVCVTDDQYEELLYDVVTRALAPDDPFGIQAWTSPSLIDT